MKATAVIKGIGFAFCLGLSAVSSASSVNLLTNGTFDSSLTGWTQAGTLPTTWISGTAHIGRPGTPGESEFYQSFSLSSLTTGVLQVDFEYQWQINPPAIADQFTAKLVYEKTGGGLATVTLVNEQSNSVTFNSTFFFTDVISLVDADLTKNATISFSLTEHNATNGTRIQLDDVNISAVPLPPAAILFGSAIIGVSLLGRRRLLVKKGRDMALGA